MTYYQRNKEIMLAKQNARNNTPEGKKRNRISNWVKLEYEKNIGDTYDEIYEKYINKTNCERCDVLFVSDDIPYHDAKKYLTKQNNIICKHCAHWNK